MQYRRIVLKEGNSYSLPLGIARQDIRADPGRPAKCEDRVADRQAREAHCNDETIADALEGARIHPSHA